MLKIGTLKLKSNLILAPMAGITDLPYRMLCRRFGCELAFVEMINCRSVSYKSRKTKEMLSTINGDSPLGVQILGCEEHYILKSLEVLSNYKFDILDFNAACPAKKVVRRGEGAGLLKDAKKFEKIIKLVVKNCKLPVTVKIRIGWDKDSVNAAKIALIAQESGVSAVFVHGRTKEQGYSGTVDYRVIADVRRALSVPLIASGDVFSGELAAKMVKETGCAGLAIARGSLGNPWVFAEVKEFLKSGKVLPRPSREEVIKVMLGHLEATIAFYGEKNGVVIFRKFYSWYTKGFRKVRRLRELSSRAKTRSQMEEIIRQAS